MKKGLVKMLNVQEMGGSRVWVEPLGFVGVQYVYCRRLKRGVWGPRLWTAIVGEEGAATRQTLGLHLTRPLADYKCQLHIYRPLPGVDTIPPSLVPTPHISASPMHENGLFGKSRPVWGPCRGRFILTIDLVAGAEGTVALGRDSKVRHGV
jgi:hypothetical protein